MITKILIGLVALQHYFIMFMEMFLWEKRGPLIFKNFDKEVFGKTTAMAKNMGLYNGFLAVGLTISLFVKNPLWSKYIALYFLGCVIVAGLYASLTAEKTIFLKQSLVAIIAVLLIVWSPQDDAQVSYKDIKVGMTQEEVYNTVGQPQGSLSGLYGDIYLIGEKRVIVYYEFNEEKGHPVTDIKIDDIEE